MKNLSPIPITVMGLLPMEIVNRKSSIENRQWHVRA